MGVTIQCNQVALAKIICHAAKHLSSTVNGLLLGKVEGNTVRVTDVIPLFHTASICLACPTEVALAQVAAQTEGLGTNTSIVGYYHSDYRMQASDLTSLGRKIADKLAAKQPSAVVLLLDNRKLATYMSGEDTPPFDAFTKDGAKGWHRHTQAGGVVVADGSWRAFLSEVLQLLKQQLHKTLVDFDDHLDDISKDYFNPQLAKLGKFALPGQA